MDRTLLSPYERFSVSLLESISCRPDVKNLLQRLSRFSASWIALCTRNLWELRGFEPVAQLEAPQGLILVSNHRSFFDMYVCATVLHLQTQLGRRQFFPVRSSFFYDNPLGLLVQFSISTGAMWPPVFREPRRRRLNKTGVEQMAHVLSRGALVGIHPEGRRNKTDDPYKLLPPHNGVGKLIASCHPDTVVLPYFILGLSNSIAGEIRRNFRPPGKRGEPIRIEFHQPLRAGDLREQRGPKQVAQQLMSLIGELGERDRARRLANPRSA